VTQQATDRLNQLVGAGRFEEKGIRTDCGGFSAVILLSASCKHDDRHAHVSRVGAQDAQKAQPVHIWQTDVENSQIALNFSQPLYGAFSAPGSQGCVASLTKLRAEDALSDGVIIHNQDRSHFLSFHSYPWVSL
jgi:hypothetical protein